MCWDEPLKVPEQDFHVVLFNCVEQVDLNLLIP